VVAGGWLRRAEQRARRLWAVVGGTMGRRPVTLAVRVLVGVVLLLVAAAAAERLGAGGRVLVGVRLAGVQVAGRPAGEVRNAIAMVAERREAEPVVATAGTAQFRLSPRAVGLRVDAAATADAVLRAGRQRDPLTWLIGPLTRRVRPVDVGWVVRYDRGAVAHTVDGQVRLDGARVTTVAPQAGRVVERARAIDAVASALTEPGPPRVRLPLREVPPRIDAAAVERVAAQARLALAGPVTLRTPRGQLIVAPRVLATALRAVWRDGGLWLDLDTPRLRAGLGGPLRGLERPPRDARLRVEAGRVRIEPSATGDRLDLAVIFGPVLRGERQIGVGLRQVQPARSTQWARSLRIRERVSSFTTNHQPGQPRVGNIHRAADLLRFQVVEPGGRFSLNRALGPRTPTRGFVRAPVIADGEFSQDYGGGVSQLATPVFNAVFFGGYPIVSYQPHSYFISRYPMGREATVSLPAPDLVFDNDTGAGVLIDTSYTDSSITVTFYGDRAGRTVEAEGPRILAVRRPGATTESVEDPRLPAGTVQVEPAFAGYDVEVFRVITRPGEPVRRQRFFTRYRASPAKVIRGTGPG